MLVCIYICLAFVLFASHNILAWMTLPPVIALGVFLLSHAGEKSSGVCYELRCLPPVTRLLEILGW